jgi:glycine/D-amino acid oxidase-like deaminating enzyme
MTVAVIGGGLAGSLLALELRQQGLPVVLFDAGPPPLSATALSYGAVAAWAAPATPLGQLMRQAPRRWSGLQRRHGALGWRRRWLRLHGPGALQLLRGLPLPCGQMDVARFGAAMPAVLEGQGVRCLRGRVERLARQSGLGGWSWQIDLPGGGVEQVEAVVLAAGARGHDLWPALGAHLRMSWAGVLELHQWPPGYRRGLLLLPGRFERLALERRAAQLQEDSWVVDPGLVPWGDTALVGQISLVRPASDPGGPPDPALMEQRLREGLERFDPVLAEAPGTFRQAPVAFCSDGQPLVGPVPEAPGLWQFCGFSAAFAQVPVLAPLLAAVIAGDATAARHLALLTRPN